MLTVMGQRSRAGASDADVQQLFLFRLWQLPLAYALARRWLWDRARCLLPSPSRVHLRRVSATISRAWKLKKV